MMKQGKKNDPPSQISDVALYVLVLLLLAFQIAIAQGQPDRGVVWQPKAICTLHCGRRALSSVSLLVAWRLN
jgi:hypothetical protein